MKFKKGVKVICIRQPKELFNIILKGETGKIVGDVYSDMPLVNFGDRLGGSWYIKKSQIKLYKGKKL